ERLARLALPVEEVPGRGIVEDHDGARRRSPRAGDLGRGHLQGRRAPRQRDLLEAELPVAPDGGEEEVTERGGQAPEVAAEDVRARQAEELLRSTVHPGHVSARVDGDRAVLQMGEDLLDEAVRGPDGAEERDVLDRHGDLTGQREEPLEILGAVRLTGDAR